MDASPVRSLLSAALLWLGLVGCADLPEPHEDDQDLAAVDQADRADLGRDQAVELDAEEEWSDSGSDAARDSNPAPGDADAFVEEEDECLLGSLPEGWESTFIGPNREGSAAGSLNASTICLKAGGEDIIGRADDFLFVHQARQGDVMVTARLARFEADHEYAKAGLMVRASLDPGSARALVNATPGDEGDYFNFRSVSDGDSEAIRLMAQAGDRWLRLTKRGTRLLGERSADGLTWQSVGAVQLPDSVSGEALIGLALTSHQGEQVAQARFEQVSLSEPEALEQGCGDGLCMLQETCTTCPADCSCDALGIEQSPYIKTSAPQSVSRPTSSSPVTSGGLRYTLVDAETRNYYSNVPAFNADDTLLLLSGSRAPLYDAETLVKVRHINASFFKGHRAWLNLPEHRTKMFGASLTAVYLYDVLTDDRELLYDFSEEYDEIRFGPGEGSVSNDDRMVALVGKKGGHAHVMAFDLVKKKVVGKKVFTGRWPEDEAKPRFDYAMISASGHWVVVNTRNSGSGGHMRYDLTFQDELQVTPLGKHADVCVNQAGEEVLIALSSPSHGMYRLSDGQKQQLPTFPDRYGGHISCQNTSRPGWAYVGRSGTEELLALKLDDTETVERFGWHFSTQHDYRAEAHACPSRDGSRVVFNSDWGSESRANGAYIVERAR